MSDGKILVVEDDEDLVHMLEYNITRKGYATMTALDGLDACYLIEEEKPDLILLDVMLPGLSGFEICEIIRNHYHEEISDIPIIMLTALGSMENKLKGIETGADDYIPKPFTLKEVLLKVDRLVCKEKMKKQMNMKVKNLEAREKQQTDFQSMLFHELRNQLLIIGGYSSIAQRHELTPEKHRHYAGVIKESSCFLNSLVEEIFLLSRVETGEYPLPREEVCLEGITQQIISVLLQQATEKDIGKIFNKFYRGENVKNKTKGTSIGLYIAKTLIEAMGGIIRVESKNGNGSYFKVVLRDLYEIHD